MLQQQPKEDGLDENEDDGNAEKEAMWTKYGTTTELSCSPPAHINARRQSCMKSTLPLDQKKPLSLLNPYSKAIIPAATTTPSLPAPFFKHVLLGPGELAGLVGLSVSRRVSQYTAQPCTPSAYHSWHTCTTITPSRLHTGHNIYLRQNASPL